MFNIMIYTKYATLLHLIISGIFIHSAKSVAFKHESLNQILIPSSENKTKVLDSKQKLIGILTLDLTQGIRSKMENQISDMLQTNNIDALDFFNRSSYFPKSYADWLKQFDAVVIPLDINQEPKDLHSLMDKLDGLLLTGGASPLYEVNDQIAIDRELADHVKVKKPSFYTGRVAEIVKHAKKINENKKFPLWATCLGFESLLITETEYKIVLDFVDNIDFNNTVTFTNQEQDMLDGDENGQFIEISQNQEVYYFNHNFGFFTDNSNIDEIENAGYEIIATTKTKAKRDIIAFVKHRSLPFYAVQYHPEKIEFEHSSEIYTNKSADSIKIAQAHAKMFIDEIDPKDRSSDDVADIISSLDQEFEVYGFSPLGVFDLVHLFVKKPILK